MDSANAELLTIAVATTDEPLRRSRSDVGVWDCWCAPAMTRRGAPSVLRRANRNFTFNSQGICMKLVRSLIAASLLVGVAPNVVFADCNPPCKGDRVCRYDSTHNPQFFCRKPVAPQSASSPAPVGPAVAPAKPAGWVNSVEFPAVRSKVSPAQPKTSKSDNCIKWQPSEDDASKRARPKKC